MPLSNLLRFHNGNFSLVYIACYASTAYFMEFSSISSYFYDWWFMHFLTFQVSFIDLDMKPLKKMEYYYKLDQEIVQFYTQMVKTESHPKIEVHNG